MQLIILYLIIGVILSTITKSMATQDNEEFTIIDTIFLLFTWPAIFLITGKVIADELQDANSHLEEVKQLLEKLSKPEEVTHHEVSEKLPVSEKPPVFTLNNLKD